MKISQAYNKSKSWLLPWQPYSIPSKSKLDYPSSLANWGGKGFIFLPFCEWLSLRKVVLSNFWNCFNHLVAVVHFHFWLFLDFRTVFVEIKLPILLYYWITYFFIRGDEKFPFFRPVQAILGCSKLNDFPPKGIPAVKWHLNNKNFCWKYFFSCICLSIQNVKTTMFESKQQSHNDVFYRFVWISRDVSG